MAQAARLSQRMQKELKLLLTDPPPGASFPLLSTDAPSSLSTIHAEIEGPEGTVYAKGIFKLKIQIPERYPFQPPIVTFTTPIYHPNIDNGGRICLDILNLPPKGAWQPSLNISTVLTSIGLLLSEPNPDDGLMCEASREYKYNRHAFDQKARSVTEKFATAAAKWDEGCGKSSDAQSSASMTETKGSEVLNCDIDDGYASNKRVFGNDSKLSLESIKSQHNKDSDVRVNEKPIIGVKGTKEVSMQKLDKNLQHHENSEYHKPHGNSQWTKRKLSLGTLGPSEQKVDDDNKAFEIEENSSSLKSLNNVLGDVFSHCNERIPHQIGNETTADNQHMLLKNTTNRTSDNFAISKRTKLSLGSKRLSLGRSGSSQAQRTGNKENSHPIPSFSCPSPNSPQSNKQSGDSVAKFSENIGCSSNVRISDKFQLEPLGQLKDDNFEKQQKMEESILSESVIVLDSEDSEEESNRYPKSRPLLARKRLSGKWKAKGKC